MGGQLAFPPDPNEPQFDKPYSDATAQLIDEEAKKIVAEAYARTKALLQERAGQVEALALLLLEKETINQDDIVSVLGQRPFESHTEYNEILQASWSPEGNEGPGGEEDAETEAGGIEPSLACKQAIPSGEDNKIGVL